MCNTICDAWNKLYALNNPEHLASLVNGNVNIHESQEKDGLTDVNFNVVEAVEFNSRKLDSFTFWDSLSSKNCDGAYLIKNPDGTFDMVLIELKSKFGTEKIYDAKIQILETLIKIKLLIKNSKQLSKIHLKREVGLIVSFMPKPEQMTTLKAMLSCDENKLGNHKCGIMLLKYHKFNAPTNDDRFTDGIIGETIPLYYHPAKNIIETIDLESIISDGIECSCTQYGF